MRKLRKEEYDLIIYLLRHMPNTEDLIDQLEDSTVEEIDDGGMGSLKFIRNDKSVQKFGKMAAEISLLDKDKVPVSFAIMLDTDGNLYELDAF